MNAIVRQLFTNSVVTVILVGWLGGGSMLPAQEQKAGNDSIHRIETGLRALTSEGCYRREAIWVGEVTSGRRVMLPFFFFKENNYILVIATDDTKIAEASLNIEMFDLVGIPMACHTGAGEGRIAVAARPISTGTCYLSLTLPEGSRPLKVAVGCAFK